MIYEQKQLVRVISRRRTYIQKETQCKCCGVPFNKGDLCSSIGVRDDWNNCWERWYLCTNCEEALSISAGTPRYLQDWALENRLTLETWSD